MSKKEHLWNSKGKKNGGYNAWKSIGKKGEPNWTLVFFGVWGILESYWFEEIMVLFWCFFVGRIVAGMWCQ
jgi:hypothetical protein